MADIQLVPIEQFCSIHEIEISFIEELSHSGLIEVQYMKSHAFILQSQMHELERLVRLHYDLDINIEGLEAITHLLQRINRITEENRILKNKLDNLDLGQ
jgi:hypothetical protein